MDNVVSLLASRFSGFWRERDSDDLSLPYLVFADFSRWLISKMELMAKDVLVSEAFDFLEELLTVGDPNISNMLALTVAEQLADNFSNLDNYPVGEKMSALINAERFPL